MSIATELSRIQKTLKAPKNQMNKFGGYKYRSAEDILEAAKPLLDECFLTLSDKIEQVGKFNYVVAQATLWLADESIMVEARAREAETKKGMDDSQITGAASSYARKYALNGLFAIDDTKDSDYTNDHGKRSESNTAPHRPKQQATRTSTPDKPKTPEMGAPENISPDPPPEPPVYAGQDADLLLNVTDSEAKWLTAACMRLGTMDNLRGYMSKHGASKPQGLCRKDFNALAKRASEKLKEIEGE